MTLVNIKHKTPPPNQIGMVLQAPDPNKEKIYYEEDIGRQTQMVPWSECVPLIDKIKELTDWGTAQILQEAGYSAESNFEKWVKKDVAAKRFKMALLGILYTLGYKTEPTFTHDELADLFLVTMGNTISNEHRRKMLTKIAKEMANSLGG